MISNDGVVDNAPTQRTFSMPRIFKSVTTKTFPQSPQTRYLRVRAAEKYHVAVRKDYRTGLNLGCDFPLMVTFSRNMISGRTQTPLSPYKA
jgi:hypothetical protein